LKSAQFRSESISCTKREPIFSDTFAYQSMTGILTNQLIESRLPCVCVWLICSMPVKRFFLS